MTRLQTAISLGYLFALGTTAMADVETAGNKGFGAEVEVALVQIELRVENNKAEFAAGLTAADFEVAEDGQPARVESVEEVSPRITNQSPTSVPGQVLTAPASSGVAGASHDSTILLIVDQANSSMDAVARQRSHLLRFVRSLAGTDTYVAVFALRPTGNFHMLSGFSRSLTDALQATEQIRSGGAGMAERRSRLQLMESMLDERLHRCSGEGTERGEACSDRAYQQLLTQAQQFAQEERARATTSLESLRKILGFSDHLPGRRSVMLVSEGIDPGGTSYFNAAAQLVQYTMQTAGTRGASRWISDIQRAAAEYSYRQTIFQELTDTAVAARVTINWINPAHEERISGMSPEGQLGSYSFGQDLTNVANPISLMRDLALTTGGVALARAAKVDQFYDRVADDLKRYYVLSYAPARSGHDGRSHDVVVKVKRDGLRVHARRSYVDHTDEHRKLRGLATALDFPDLFADGLDLKSSISFFRTGESYEVAIRSAIPYREIAPLLRDGSFTGTLQFGYALRDAGGNPVRIEQPYLHLSHSAEQFQALSDGGAYIDYRYVMTIKPGHYQLTVAVLDDASHRAGSKRHSLSLPELGDGCLSSTPLLLARHIETVPETTGAVHFDELGNAYYRAQKLAFSALTELPATGSLAGLYQLINPSRDASGLTSLEVSFRLFRGDSPVNQTPITRVAREIDSSSGAVISYFSVPYSGLPRGTYRLELVAKDLLSGCVAIGSVNFEVQFATPAGVPEPGKEGSP